MTGAFADDFSNLLTFGIGAVATIISHGVLAILVYQPFSIWIHLLNVIFLILAGFAGSIATITSIATCVKNFDRQVGMLTLTLFLTYMKLSTSFDDCLVNAFL